MKRYYTLFGLTIVVCFVVELLSYLSFHIGWLNPVIGGLIVITTLILSLKNLKYGLGIIMIEAIIGSQGYLFSLSGSGGGFSLRIALWIAVMAVWLLTIISEYRRDRQVLYRYATFRYARPLALIAAGVILGFSVALLAGNDLTYLFLDGKRWIFALIILPFLDTFTKKEELKELATVSFAAALWLSIKTLIIVFIFSHSFPHLTADIFGWLRADLLAEVTRLPNGFWRVFMQSQNFVIPLFFVSALSLVMPWQWLRENKGSSIALVGIATAASATLMACLSRSFWIGTVVAVVVWILVQLIFIRKNWNVFFKQISVFAVTVFLGLILLVVIVRFPFPEPSTAIDASLLSDRATQNEAGSASRWSLLPVLWKEVSASPLWGKGFGTTVTYVTSDPRITLSTTDGKYTTYAFEWGWLDLWLKTGLIGVLGYLWLFYMLLSDCYRLMRRGDSRALAVGLSLSALGVLHFFTPYLNHPLGFSYLILAMLAVTFLRTQAITRS